MASGAGIRKYCVSHRGFCRWKYRIAFMMSLVTTAVVFPHALLSQISVSPLSLSFGNQKVGSLSDAQSVRIDLNVSGNFAPSVAISGPNAGDFLLAVGSKFQQFATVVFAPQHPGAKSASLVLTYTIQNAPQTAVVPITGTAVLSGRFEIVNSLTGKVLDVANGSAADGTSVQQNALNGSAEQQWKFVPQSGEYYEIVNAVTGKVLDVTGGSLSNGAAIQEWDSSGAGNQSWQLVPVDDVHYAIMNQQSGKVLDLTGGSPQNGTPIQQWDYLGDPQQLWVLVPAEANLIANPVSASVFDLTGGSVQNGALLQQWVSNGNRQQQWQFMAVGGGYYAVLNLLTGKVLDDTAGSLLNGTQIQQWDYLGGLNQQWQLLPFVIEGPYASPITDLMCFQFVNRLSGKVLDVTSPADSNGDAIQQWDNLYTTNQIFQVVSLPFWNIQNQFSNLVLDVPGGSTANGTNVQQWASNGNLQQQWQIVPVNPYPIVGTLPSLLPSVPSGQSAIKNVLTGKALEVPNNVSSDGTLVDQSDYTAASNQLWTLLGTLGYIQNLQSGKVLDDTGFSISNGTLIQQWDYLGHANQVWQLVLAPN